MSKPASVTIIVPYPNVNAECEDCKQDLDEFDIFYHYQRNHLHYPKSILSMAEYLKSAYNEIARLKAQLEALKGHGLSPAEKEILKAMR